jgi:hypothetical protein
MIDPVRRRLNLLHNTTNSAKREPLDALDYDAIMTLADIATGRHTQLNITDLIDLGLFPQLTDITNTTTTPDTTTPTTPGTTTPDTGAPSDDAGPAGTDTCAATPSSSTRSTTAPSTTVTETAVTVAAAGQAVAATLFGLTGDDAPDGTNARVGVKDCGNTDTVESDIPTGWETPPPITRRPGRAKKLAGSPAQVMIRVDLDTLLRGVPLNGELCEIAGYGPIPVSTINDLITNENPFIVGILTKGKQIIGVYHHRRRPSAHQKSALDFLYPTCAAAGCNTRTSLQYDHRQDWAKTKFTVYDLLDRLCTHHHNLKTRNNWNLVNGTGKRPFVPPDHPDHPNHAGARVLATNEAPARQPTGSSP